MIKFKTFLQVMLTSLSKMVIQLQQQILKGSLLNHLIHHQTHQVIRVLQTLHLLSPNLKASRCSQIH